MLRPRIIPSLLVHDSGLVKTVNFNNPKYVGDPINAVKIFNEKGNCASCHQLANAKSVGNIGPSLDDLKPTQAQVKQAVTNGIGIMPAFGNDKILTPQEIEAVSFYVEKVAGN